MEGASALVGRGLVEILPDFRKWGAQLASDMRIARSQLDGSATGLRRSAATVGASMAKVGKGTSALGLGVAAVSVKMAADFQSHTAVLQTAAGETSKGLTVVREGIKNIAVGTGTGIQNLTDGMYTIEKAGFRGSKGLQVLQAAAQGAREENAKLSDVTNAMTSIMASYHLGASKSVQVMNAMKTAAGEGKITMEEFSGAMSTVLPIASANKISFDQVAGAVATLTQHGTSAREATHELGATIRALAAPNNVAIREMSRFGLSSVDVSQKLGKRGLTGTIELLTETILHKMGPGGKILLSAFEGSKQSAEDARIMISKMPADVQGAAKAFLAGTIEADKWNATVKGSPVAVAPMLRNFKTLVDRSRGFSRELKSGGPATKTYTDALKKMSGGAIGLNTILQLSGESFDGFKDRVDKVGASLHHNTKDVEGWKTTSKLLSVQMDRVKAQVQVLAINLGTRLLPAVSAVVGYFAQHRSVLLAVAAATGVFISATAGAYVGMKLYAAGARAAAIATGAYNVAMRLGARYALGTRVQLAALFVWQKLQATWTGIVTAAQWAWNAAMTANPIGVIIVGIGLLIGAVVLIATKTKWFQKLWDAIWGFIRKPVLAFVGWLKNNWQLVVWGLLTGGIGLAVAWIVRHWDAVKHAFSVTIDWVKHNWPLLLAIITGPIGLAVLYIVKHWKQIARGAEDAYHGTVGWFVRMGKDIGSFFAGLPGQISDFFTRAVPAFFESAWKSVSGFFTQLPGRLALLMRSLGSSEIHAALALDTMGRNLIEGLWKGATDFFTKSVPHFFKTLWSGIVDFFKVVFGIHSPSTVMAALGVYLIQGLLGGILSAASGLITFLSVHVAQPIAHFFTQTIPNAASAMKDKVLGFWQGEATGLSNIWGWIKKSALHPIVHFFTRTIPDAASAMRDRVVGFWHAEYTGLSNIWGWIKKAVLHPLGDFFTKTVPGWASSLKDKVVGRWGALRDGLHGVFSSIKSHTLSPMGNFFTKTIPGWAGKMKDKVTGFFRGMRDGVGSLWDGIRDKTKSPVNWVLDHVWNKGIYSVWKTITRWIGISNKLGKIKLLAAGGTVGTQPFGVFNKPTAIVGEGNSAYPEYVIPTDPKYATRARGLWEAAGAHFYEDGGILGTIGSAIGSAAGKVTSFSRSAVDFLSDPLGKAKKLLLGPLKGLSRLGQSSWVKMIARLPGMAVDGLLKAVKSVGSDVLGAIGLGGSSGGSGVERWRPTVLTALRMVGQVPALADVTLRRMNQESGGNPTIVNRWDSNWERGTPSVGLMQVIGPTFQHYAGKMRNVGPFLYGVSTNGLANTYASMRYALARYGSLTSAYGRPGGYELGTAGSSAGWHWVGENGPELAKLPAGTKIRSNRASVRQAPATASVVHLTVENHGVIASRREAEDWLTRSLEQLRRKNRLPRALGGVA
jgi:SLT domain-containing protein